MTRTTRLATWVDIHLMKRLRVRAAMEGRSFRSIVEQGMAEFKDNHPIDMKEVEHLTK